VDYSQRRTTSSIKVKWYTAYPGVTIIQRNCTPKEVFTEILSQQRGQEASLTEVVQ